MKRQIRTDLALEAREIWQEGAQEAGRLDGVKCDEEDFGSFRVTTVDILDERGSAELGKAVGRYVTIELDGLIHREENAFEDAVQLLARSLRQMLPSPVRRTGQSRYNSGCRRPAHH